jgi:hypothetical protein
MVLTIGALGAGNVPSASAQVVDPYARANHAYSAPYWGYVADPYGGYLHGVADVVRSQGQFLQDLQHAKLLHEEVRRSKVDSRRKELEQWLWERENLPTPQEERERMDREFLRQSRFSATPSEIISGNTLNILYKDALKIKSEGANAAPLDPAMLTKINLTTGNQDADLGVIKSGKVKWPHLFFRPQFTDDRKEIDKLVKRAVDKAASGGRDDEAIDELARKVDELEGKIKALTRTFHEGDTFTAFLCRDSKKFHEQLRVAVRSLLQADVGEYINGKYTAQGNNVAELVKYMRDHGLQFARATPGNEAAYMALYHALVAYDGTEGSQFKTKDVK